LKASICKGILPVCRIVFYAGEPEFLDFIAKKLCGGEGGFDFDAYDSGFKLLKKKESKRGMALNRLRCPFGLSKASRREFANYVDLHYSEFHEDLEDDPNAIKLLEECGVITLPRLDRIIDRALEKRNIEFLSHLLELKNKEHGFGANKSLVL
jgi:hypothetical protein